MLRPVILEVPVKRLVHACAALALVLCATPQRAADAAVSETGFTIFEAVDSAGADEHSMEIDGLVQGETTSRTVTFYFFNSATTPTNVGNCMRQALLAQAKPGRYFFEVRPRGDTETFCRLRRR